MTHTSAQAQEHKQTHTKPNGHVCAGSRRNQDQAYPAGWPHSATCTDDTQLHMLEYVHAIHAAQQQVETICFYPVQAVHTHTYIRMTFQDTTGGRQSARITRFISKKEAPFAEILVQILSSGMCYQRTHVCLILHTTFQM